MKKLSLLSTSALCLLSFSTLAAANTISFIVKNSIPNDASYKISISEAKYDPANPDKPGCILGDSPNTFECSNGDGKHTFTSIVSFSISQGHAPPAPGPNLVFSLDNNVSITGKDNPAKVTASLKPENPSWSSNGIVVVTLESQQ